MTTSSDDAAIRRVVLLGMGGFFAVVLVVLIVLLQVYREPEAGWATSASRASGPVREIEVVAREFSFDPAAVDVTPGETIRFVVTNTGKVQHELRLTRQEDIDSHLEEVHSGHAGDVSEMEPGMLVVEPGETATLEWTFDQGPEAPDRIACLLPGHYEAGMKGELAYTR